MQEDDQVMGLSKGKKMVGVVAVMCAFILFLFLILPSPAKPVKYSADLGTVTLPENEHEKYRLYTINNDWVEIDLKVVSGDNIDVYILSQPELKNYIEGKEFSPVFQKENVSYVYEDYHVDTYVDYFLVVDNRDNARETDAVPSGDIEFTLEFQVTDPHWWESVAGWDGMLWIIGLVFIVCYIAIYFIITAGQESHNAERMKIISARKPPPPHIQEQMEKEMEENSPGKEPVSEESETGQE